MIETLRMPHLSRLFLVLMAFLFSSGVVEATETNKLSRFSPSESILRDFFERGSVVEQEQIDGQDLIRIIQSTDDDIVIRNTTILNGLDFSDLKTITNKITLQNVTIKNTTRREVSILGRPGMIFLKSFSIRHSRIEGTVKLEGIRAMADFDFHASHFQGKLQMSGSTFEKNIRFSQSRFFDEFDFRAVVSKQKALFNATQFAKAATFREGDFARLILGGVRFETYVDFRHAVISILDFDSSAHPASIKGYFDFRRAIISDAHFQDISFENNVDFSDTIFLSVIFKDVSFERNSYFLRSKFRIKTAFDTVRFHGISDFTAADLSSNQQFLWSYVGAIKLLLGWTQFPPLSVWVNDRAHHPSFSVVGAEKRAQKKTEKRVKIGGLESLTKVLGSLKTLFRAQKQVSDANEAYFYERELSLKRAQTEDLLPKDLTGAFWIIWGHTAGYGMRILWISLWCLSVNLFFTVLYFVGGTLQTSSSANEVFRLRLFDFPRRYVRQTESKIGDRGLESFIKMFFFSAVILMKVGPRTKTLSGRIMGFDLCCLIRFEWLIGFYFLGALSVTLSNTVPIINRLLTGIF